MDYLLQSVGEGARLYAKRSSIRDRRQLQLDVLTRPVTRLNSHSKAHTGYSPASSASIASAHRPSRASSFPMSTRHLSPVMVVRLSSNVRLSPSRACWACLRPRHRLCMCVALSCRLRKPSRRMRRAFASCSSEVWLGETSEVNFARSFSGVVTKEREANCVL